MRCSQIGTRGTVFVDQVLRASRRRFTLSRSSMTLASLALRQIQRLLGDEALDELIRDRRDARDGDFAEQARDVVSLGLAEAARASQ